MAILTNKAIEETVISCRRANGFVSLCMAKTGSGKMSVDMSVDEALGLVDLLQDAIDSFDEGDEK